MREDLSCTMQSFFFALAAVVVQCGHAFVPNPGVVVVGKSFAVPTVRLTKVRAAGRGAAAPLAATKEKPETEVCRQCGVHFVPPRVSRGFLWCAV